MVVFGIDLGTTNTVATVRESDGNNTTLEWYGGDGWLLPTVIHFISKDEYEIGNSALMASFTDPDSCIMNFKTALMDDSRSSYDPTVIASNGDRLNITSEKAMSLFLQKLIVQIDCALDRKSYGDLRTRIMNETTDSIADNMVITVPVSFLQKDSSAITNLRKAAWEANIPIRFFLSEPHAVVSAYNDAMMQVGECVLVYDFGGGTFDVCVIEKTSTGTEVLDSRGENGLGGNNVTKSVTELAISKFNAILAARAAKDTPPVNPLPLRPEDFCEEDCWTDRNQYRTFYKDFFNTCEKLKTEHYSSDSNEFRISFKSRLIDKKKAAETNMDIRSISPELFELTFTKDELDAAIASIIDRTISITRDSVNTIHRMGKRIDRILLNGGSSKLPGVRTALDRLADEAAGANGGRFSIEVSGDRSSLVSQGAAISGSEYIKNISYDDVCVGYRTQNHGVPLIFEPIPTWDADGSSHGCINVTVPINTDGRSRIHELYFYKVDKKLYAERAALRKLIRTSDECCRFIQTVIIPGFTPKAFRCVPAEGKIECKIHYEFSPVSGLRITKVTSDCPELNEDYVITPDIRWINNSDITVFQ